MPEKVVIVLYN